MPLLRKNRLPNLADVATDDWAPVPATSTAAPNSWADWLVEPDEEPKPPRRPLAPAPERPMANQRFGIELVGHVDPTRPRGDTTRPRLEAVKRNEIKAKPAETTPMERSFDKYLTAEERAIIDQQRQVVVKPRLMPLPAKPSKASLAPSPPRPAPKPLAAPSKKKQSSIDKYLTAEERQILEAQQSGRLRRLTGKTPARPMPRAKTKTDEIVKDLGTHLTEEERKIIEQQLG